METAHAVGADLIKGDGATEEIITNQTYFEAFTSAPGLINSLTNGHSFPIMRRAGVGNHHARGHI